MKNDNKNNIFRIKWLDGQHEKQMKPFEIFLLLKFNMKYIETEMETERSVIVNL